MSEPRSTERSAGARGKRWLVSRDSLEVQEKERSCKAKCTGRCFRHAMRNKISRTFERIQVELRYRTANEISRLVPKKRLLSLSLLSNYAIATSAGLSFALTSYCLAIREETMIRASIRESLTGAPHFTRPSSRMEDTGRSGVDSESKNRAIERQERNARSERGRRVVGREQWITFAAWFKVRASASRSV